MMTPEGPSALTRLHDLIRHGEWLAAMEWLVFRVPSPSLQLAWHLCGEYQPHGLFQACNLAWQQGDMDSLHRWYTALTRDRYDLWRARLGERRLTCAIDMLRAAGLVLTARHLAAGGQPLACQDLCTWVDEAVDQASLTEALVQRLIQQQTSQPVVSGEGLALLCLETLYDLLSDQHLLSAERLALLRAYTRDWCETSSTRVCRAVPLVCEDAGAGLSHDLLEVELLTPGNGQAIQHWQDVLALPTSPTPDTARQAPATFDDTFRAAIQRALQAACTLAQRWDADARWRLLRGPNRTPVLAGQGGSASGQALRAFYNALTDTWPEAGVMVLAEVSDDAQRLRGVSNVPQKVRAMVQAVQARQADRGNAARQEPGQVDPGQCDTLVVASAANEGDAWAALRETDAASLLRVVWASTPQEACTVRSRLGEELTRYYADLKTRAGNAAWYQAATPLRFVQLTLLLDQGPEASGPRWQHASQTFDDLPAILAHVPDPAIVVLGPPGSGKSTLLRHYELELARIAQGARGSEQPAPLAFFVSLNDYRPLRVDAPLPAPRDWLAARWATRVSRAGQDRKAPTWNHR